MSKLISWLPRFRKAYASLGPLRVHESWSRPRIETFQLEKINQIWSHAINHVEYYRTESQRLDLPRKFDDLAQFKSRVPVLPKTTVRDSAGRFLSDNPEPGAWHHTSGSTGSPTAVYHEHEMHRAMLQRKYRFNESWDLDFLDPWVFIWGNSGALANGISGVKHRVLTPVQDWLRNRLRLSPYDLRPSTLQSHLKRIAAFQPVAIYSHSMAAHLLAVEAKKTGFECPSLKAVILTSEPVRPATIAAVNEGFNVPAIQEYGCVECGFIAGESPDGSLRVREDFVFVETVERTDGRFDVVLTILDNPSFPLIRYAVGDVTEQPIGLPDEGFAILPAIQGRDFDLVVSKTGAALHGQVFEDIIDRYAGIRIWRLHQDLNGSVRVSLQKNEKFQSSSVHEIQSRFAALLDGFEVQVKTAEDIPLSRSGKYQTVYSELSRENNRSFDAVGSEAIQ